MRGARFVPSLNYEDVRVFGPEPAHARIALKALEDVARWLGYPNYKAYNVDTVQHPREVQQRLKAAK